MKITVVGGGSTYSPELAEGLAKRAAALALDTLTLTDIDADRLATVGGFVTRMVRAIAPKLRVELCADVSKALGGADFVVTQIRAGGQDARIRDEKRGKRFGLLGQETTGVSGFCKAMRTVPRILEICEGISKHAPNATLVNFTNPVSIVTEAIVKETDIRAIGLCNIPIGLRMDLAKILGVDPSVVRLDSVGLNHLSFVRGVWVGAEDVTERLLRDVGGRREGKPANIPELDYPEEFLGALRMIPSDYLRYFFLHKEAIEDQAQKSLTRAEEVLAIEKELLAIYADPNVTTKPDALGKRGGAYYSHAAIEVIEAIAHDRPSELTVDVRNGSAVRELPEDSVVEVPCIVDRRGAQPLAQRALEPSIRGLLQHVKAYEELAVTAAVTRSRKTALLALAAHPLVSSVNVAVDVVNDIAEELALG